jgi:hypothetical protein
MQTSRHLPMVRSDARRPITPGAHDADLEDGRVSG